MVKFSTCDRNCLQFSSVAQSCPTLCDPMNRSTPAQRVKRLSTMRETWVRALGWEDPLEKEMAIYYRTIAWKIPWTEEPGRLQSMGLQTVGQDSDFTTPGLPVHHLLPEFTQTHVHRVSDAIQPSHPLSSPSPPTPNPSQHQSLFQ